jgi:hypothetical protein
VVGPYCCGKERGRIEKGNEEKEERKMKKEKDGVKNIITHINVARVRST